MITRIEIDGFKTFKNFRLDLAPLQVIVGPNGAGKSNLFDALQLISHLADTDLHTAFQRMRGDAGELFTIRPNGKPVRQMKLAVELLIDRAVSDSWGEQATIKFTRLRYELTIGRRSEKERLYVEHEALRPIARGSDGWIQRHNLRANEIWLPQLRGGRSKPFISTDSNSDTPTILLHQDGHGGRKQSIVAARMKRTILGGVANTEFPHAFAVREELKKWHFLQLNPAVLGQPNSRVSPQYMETDGRYLASALARLKAESPMFLADISRDLSNLVPGLLKVEVDTDIVRDEYIIRAKMQDGRLFSSRVLSDGTLRMLALIALKNDPDHSGTLCFEEPENGIHPARLKAFTQMLQELATDFSNPEDSEFPLRQFLSNTHSPVFISQPTILPYVLFASGATRIDPDYPNQPERVTHIAPVTSNPQLALDLGISREQHAYTMSEVTNYLNSIDPGEALDYLVRSADAASNHTNTTK